MRINDKAQCKRRFSIEDVDDYVTLGGNRPAVGTIPEPLIGSLFSYLLGMKLPGLGTNYLKQETEFEALARIGDELTAEVEITRLRPEKLLVDLRTTCHSEAGDIICSGRALVYIPDLQSRCEMLPDE